MITLNRNKVAAKLNKFYKQQLKKAENDAKRREVELLFNNVINITSASNSNLSIFIYNIVQLTSELDCSRYIPCRPVGASDDEWRRDGSNKIKGDLFELFCYYYLHVFGGADGIHNVKFAEYDQSGYDFIGINLNNNPVVIQVKFVAGERIFGVDQDGKRTGSLETFFAITPDGYNPSVGGKCRVLITSAQNVAPFYKKLERDNKTFLIIDYKMLKKRTGNPGFWRSFYEHAVKVFPVSNPEGT